MKLRGTERKYIYIFGAAESGTIVSAVKDQKKISFKKNEGKQIIF
jgi:hypothetical protein